MQEKGSQRYPSYCFVWRGPNISGRHPREVSPERAWAQGPVDAFLHTRSKPDASQVQCDARVDDWVRLLRPSVQRMSSLLEELILKPETVLIRLDSAGGFHDAIDPCIHSELSEFTRGQ